jgi:hydroxymethylglutaryl-CoA reductase
MAEPVDSGFSKRTRDDRLAHLLAKGWLKPEDVALLRAADADVCTRHDRLVENTLGVFELPFSVAPHFVVDGVAQVIPLVVEETSVVAALSKAAKWIQGSGQLTTSHSDFMWVMGTMHFPETDDLARIEKILTAEAASWLTLLHEGPLRGMYARGGGVKCFFVKEIEGPKSGRRQLVFHLLADCGDAMGANVITQACAALKAPFEAMTGQKVGACIVSNYNAGACYKAEVRLRDVPDALRKGIVTVSDWAQADVHRACTHNKGILNGVDALMMATGNDWRAVSASLHAHAARDGRYRGLSTWRAEGSDLVGVLEAPMMLGVVGGMTRVHPMAGLALRLLGQPDARRLGCLAAAVGLVQNLAALRALASSELVSGHMRLHINNLMMQASVPDALWRVVWAEAEAHLAQKGSIGLSDIEQMMVAQAEAGV